MAFLFAKKTHTSDQQIAGLRISASAQGLPVALAYGETRVQPNLGWYSNFLATPHTTESGGKGGGGGSTNTTYTYSAAVAFMICEGPITGYGTVWKDKDVVTTSALGLTEFLGSYTQSPWSFLTTNYPSQALNYRGSAYLANGTLDLGDNAALPNISVGVKGLLYGGAGLPDPTAAAVIADALTSANYGAGFPSAQLYSTSSFALYCTTNNLRVSPCYSELKAASEIVTALCKIGNSAPFWSEGLLKFAPFADSTSTTPIVESAGNMTTSGARYGVAYNGTVWCSPTYNTNQCQTSTDGVTWAAQTLSANSGWTGIAVVGTTFVVTSVLSNTTLTSPDGITWTSHVTALPSTGGDYLTSNGVDKLVLFTGAGDRPWYSSDGITWANSGAVLNINPSGCAFANGIFCVVSSQSRSCTSPDGIAWTLGSNTTGIPTLGGVAYGSSWVTIRSGNGTCISSDGLVWTNYTSSIPSANTFSSIIWTGNVFVAFATGTTKAAYSLDGITWTLATITSLSSPYNFGIVFNTAAGYAVGVSSSGTLTEKYVVSYVADTTVQYALDDDDFLTPDAPIKVTRKRQADAFNSVQIECLDRANSYNTYVVEAKDQANIELYGLRQLPMIQMHEICLPAYARNIAQLILQRELYIRNQYEFTVGWAYARLEPMDIVSLTDAGLGLLATSVRILSIAESDTGELQMLAEDLIVGVSTTSAYTAQTGNGYQPNQAVSAGNCVAPVVFQPPISLTTTAQVWLGTCGAAGADFGGAQIWASNDGSTYAQVGEVTQPARFGIITANWPAGVSPDITNNLSVNLSNSSGTLTTASNAQADADNTLSYVDGELVAYSTATLTANYSYTMSAYIRRGLYSSFINTHLTNSKFMRLDDAVAKIDVPPAWVGVPIYIKLLSYNSVGGGLQSLADVAATTFTPSFIGITPADGIVSTVGAQYMLTIPTGYQYTVQNQMKILGRVVNYGRLSVVP